MDAWFHLPRLTLFTGIGWTLWSPTTMYAKSPSFCIAFRSIVSLEQPMCVRLLGWSAMSFISNSKLTCCSADGFLKLHSPCSMK